MVFTWRDDGRTGGPCWRAKTVFYFCANNSFYFIESIWPLVTSIKIINRLLYRVEFVLPIRTTWWDTSISKHKLWRDETKITLKLSGDLSLQAYERSVKSSLNIDERQSLVVYIILGYRWSHWENIPGYIDLVGYFYHTKQMTNSERPYRDGTHNWSMN